ncbi:serine protease [Hymenobacter ruricola]|uniref:Serine protease n=1 Tax=Hymenobacter ruricola TaxID=2791023 RepID=A0ABS0I367_9BACT|nr:serine protease [Hymenobacter ruricola]MBF9221378.1 serine protease [Hymenobacter ruricola]
MNAILFPGQLQQAIAQVVATTDDGSMEQGTGFLVAPTLLLTAQHVVQNAAEVLVTFLRPSGPHETRATVQKLGSPTDDIAVLHLLDPPTGLEPLPLSTAVPRIRAQWETQGFPQTHVLTGRPYQGIVLQRNDIIAWPLTLKVDGATPQDALMGLSGSPLVVEGQVCGILRLQQGEDVGAMLLASLVGDLTGLGLILQPAVAEQSEVATVEVVPNEMALQALAETFEAGGAGWYALVGSPGSGKSTLVAALKPAQGESFDVCGRYYLSRSTGAGVQGMAASREPLLAWLNDQASIRLQGEPAPAPDATVSFEVRLQQCWARLQALAGHFQQLRQTGVLVLDGLDETIPEPLRQEFLAVLPTEPMPGLAFLLAATSLEVLPATIREQIDQARTINVPPLDLGQCEAYLQRRLPALSAAQLHLLADRSEGHPLYLQYLIGEVETQGTPTEETTEWLSAIPRIGGKIQRYYERLWPELAAHPARLHLVLTAAALRAAIPRGEFYELVSTQAQVEFASAFPRVAHLFKSPIRVELYHASFGQFLRERAAEQLCSVQDLISARLSLPQQLTQPFSIVHRVYHWAASSTPERAVHACTQHWADACAQLHAAADTVLGDIELAKKLAVDTGGIGEVVRLHLLHMRIAYRYNELIGSHAAALATAVLALGQFEAALRYILRGDILQVDVEEALFFVQQFYERGAVEEGRQLRDYLERLGNRLVREGDVEQGFPLIGHSNTLSGYEDADAAHRVIRQCTSFLAKLQQQREDDDPEKEVAQFLQQEISRYQLAFRLWHLDKPMPRVQEMENQSEAGRLSPTAAGNWAALARTALQFREVKPTGPVPPAFIGLVQEILVLVEKYGYLDEDLVLLTSLLLLYSPDSTLVEPLANKCVIQLPATSLRAKNRVDVEPDYVQVSLLRSRCQGYVGPIDEAYPVIQSPWTSEWNVYLDSVLAYLGYFHGQLLRLRTDNRAAEYSMLLPRLRSLDKSLRFTLLMRSQWQRSYALPEAVWPFAWETLAIIYADFFPAEIDAWVVTLQQRTSEQLGLYSEGFREAGFKIAHAWRRYESLRMPTFRVLECLRTHVLAGVQNRWERTGALLRLMAAYATNHNEERSQAIYCEMLATSMGPSWYKEAQFALANTVVRHLPAGTAHIPELAAMIDLASAEMTFQRYVRSEKAALVGSLVQANRIDLAIHYYQFETVPTSEVVLANANALPLDQIRPGDGYASGARGLSEPAALVEILASPLLDPRLSWIAGQVFSRNQDIERNAYDYGALLGHTFNRLVKEQPASIPLLLPAWHSNITRQIKQDELRDYVSQFGKALTAEAHALLQPLLSDQPELLNRIQPQLANAAVRSGSDIPHEEVLQKAANEAEMGNERRAASLLGTYATGVWQTQGGTIWMAERFSLLLGQVMHQLVAYSDTAATLVQELRQPIAGSTEWEVADQLIEWTAKKVTAAEQEALAGLVKEHFRYLTQPAPQALHKYDFLLEEPVTASADAQAVELLAWHLQHPDDNWRQQAGAALVDLAAYLPEIVIPGLLGVALRPVCTGAWHEAAAALLPVIAQTYPQRFGEIVMVYPDLLEQVQQLRHFMIQHYMLEALQQVEADVPAASELHRAIWATIPLTVGKLSEIALVEEAHLEGIQVELEELNYVSRLNGAFCQELARLVAIYSQPLSTAEQIRADSYVTRSFENTSTYLPPFAAKVRYALNQAIMSRADQEGWSELQEIIAYHF